MPRQATLRKRGVYQKPFNFSKPYTRIRKNGLIFRGLKTPKRAFKTKKSGDFSVLIHPLCFLVAGFTLLWLLSAPAGAQTYQYNQQCQQAHQALLSYQLPEAKRLIAAEKARPGTNLIPYYLSHYLDFIKLYSHGSSELYDSLDDRVDNRLDKLKEGPEDSPYHSFARAEVHLLWSLLQLRREDYFSAGMDLYTAYQQYKTTVDKFPGFVPAKRILKAIEGVVGTLPDTYQWIIGRLGIEGALQASVDSYPALVKALSRNPAWQSYHRESLFIFSYMQRHLMGESDQAWQTMQEGTRDYARNPLSALLRANMALNLKKGQVALRLLEPYQHKDAPIPYLSYLTGQAMLYDLQPRSRKHFRQYTSTFEGGTYIKDAYLKMAWSALLEGNIPLYHQYRTKVREKGSTVRATDQKALKETDHYKPENRFLLKARLRYDGGYYKKARQLLEQHEPPKVSETPDLSTLEYYYRKGRIHKALDQPAKALQAFQRISHLSSYQRLHYYLPATHLQTGLIREDRSELKLAKQAFERVLGFSDYPYEQALSQKAKAGLKRLANGN